MNTVIDKHGMGIYIHIPFCVRKCVYCDFLSAPADDEVKKTYMKALADEIEYVAKCNRNKISKRIVKSIFFGGGTPTVVDAKDIECILNTVRKNFPVDSKAEITIECNPGTLNKEKADIYVQAGVNRISFGLQSPEDSLLKLLGRIHTFEQFDESVKIARAAGIRNINVDIMAALPGQSLESYVEGIKKVLRYEPEHISAYSLIIEEGTYLCDNLEEFPRLPDEDT
ncbi:MAG: coproporphyrinogen III oxidase family protein, partial [Lachnospira sp.]|nr:coproporphyrinogen III oxidase family protein [Lachnospira sp.]